MLAIGRLDHWIAAASAGAATSLPEQSVRSRQLRTNPPCQTKSAYERRQAPSLRGGGALTADAAVVERDTTRDADDSRLRGGLNEAALSRMNRATVSACAINRSRKLYGISSGVLFSTSLASSNEGGGVFETTGVDISLLRRATASARHASRRVQARPRPAAPAAPPASGSP